MYEIKGFFAIEGFYRDFMGIAYMDYIDYILYPLRI